MNLQAYEQTIDDLRLFSNKDVPGIYDIYNLTELAPLLTDKQACIYFESDQEISETIIEAGIRNDWRIREVNLEKNLLDNIFKQLSTQTAQ